MSTSTSHPTLRLIVVALALLGLFSITLSGSITDSLWMDEGYSAWIVRDDSRPPSTLRETAQLVLQSVQSTLNHVRADVHPPLYYLALDGWVWLAGDSEFSLRLPSALLASLSLAILYAFACEQFDTRTALITMIVLGTSGFYLYYAREARMYSLYLALTCLASWLYLRWWHHPSITHIMLYGVALALMLYTHYTAFTIVGAHLLHASLTVRLRIIFPFGLASLLFAPWLPIVFEQLQINTGFVAPGALPSDWGTASALWLKLTSGADWLFVVIVVLGGLSWRKREHLPALMLLVLWGLVPVISLFIINAQGLSILQLRYLIVILPAWALLVGYLLAMICLPRIYNQRWQAVPALLLTLFVVNTQLINYHTHWPAKPDWRGMIERASQTRTADEPALVYLDQRSPVVYYARQTNLLDGISINVSWREFAPPEIHTIGDAFSTQDRVWGIVAMQAPESWDAIASLSEERGVRYRDTVQWSIAYQFDRASDDTLTFSFHTANNQALLRYAGRFYTRYQAHTGEEACVPVILDAQTDIHEGYAVSVHLTRGYNEVVAQVDEPLGALNTGDQIERTYCFTKPDEDDFHLRLMVYDPQTLARLYVAEGGQIWGDYLMLGTIEQIITEMP
ncbi:MAG: glycosyltransferase family 39 protein [Anaerolineae bacterium]